jgi:ketosteroid isomerase-like protein
VDCCDAVKTFGPAVLFLEERTMNREIVKVFKAALLGIALIACAASAHAQSTKKVGDEAAIRQADEQWSNDAGTLNVEKTISYYADDASVLPPNAPIATGKDAIRTVWSGLLTPGTSISWKATKVDVAKSGDLAYLMGTYELSMKGPDGKPVNDHGKMVEVWKKQSDKQWKVVADIFNSDVPLEAPSK